MKLLLKKINLY